MNLLKTKTFAKIAMIAAIYTAVSFVPGLNSLVFGPIQIRLAEAMTILPLVYQPAIWGVTLGCLITNLLGVATGLTGALDIFVGTLATLLAAAVTWKARNVKIGNCPLLSILSPVIFNFFFVGIELAWMLNPDNVFGMMWIYGAQVAIGEIVAVILGTILVNALRKTNIFKD
jgi:uncharacterized membrane protein